MRLTTTLRASVVLAALATGSFGGAAPATLAFNIAPAQANEFYTRKRVRGRWVTGHFTRRHSATTRHSAKLDARLMADDNAQDDPGPSTSALKQRTRREPAVPVGAAQPDTPVALSEAAPLARDERLLELQAALHAHARTLASDNEPGLSVRPTPEGLRRPQSAPASPEPKAVSFDFQSGLKTTVFTDGIKVEEPFDPAAVKGLAATRPNLASSRSR